MSIFTSSSRGGGLTSLLVGSAVAGTGAGFGLSLGRDAYKFLKKNWLMVMVLSIAVFGTGYAVFDMVRGHRRGPVVTFLRTFVLNFVVIGLSIAVTAVGLSGMAKDNPGGLVMGVLAIQGISALGGFLIGMAQRGRRVRAFRIEDANYRFLADNGLRDVGGREQTILDSLGNELTLDDERRDAFVFKVKGRRNVRAYIRLDADGRMVAYDPPA